MGIREQARARPKARPSHVDVRSRIASLGSADSAADLNWNRNSRVQRNTDAQPALHRPPEGPAEADNVFLTGHGTRDGRPALERAVRNGRSGSCDHGRSDDCGCSASDESLHALLLVVVEGVMGLRKCSIAGRSTGNDRPRGGQCKRQQSGDAACTGKNSAGHAQDADEFGAAGAEWALGVLYELGDIAGCCGRHGLRINSCGAGYG